MHSGGFHVFTASAVVAYKRVGHADHLPVIGRIRKNFLISGHPCGEDDFTAGFKIAGKGLAFQREPVFQHQQCFHNYPRASRA